MREITFREAIREALDEAVRRCIAQASPGGGHIISSSNTIHSKVKPENFLSMIQAVKKYGQYPLEGKGNRITQHFISKT